MREFISGEQLYAADLNQNFKEAQENWNRFTYGETIAVNNALYISDGQEQLLNNIDQTSSNAQFGLANSSTWGAQTFKTSNACSKINKIAVLFRSNTNTTWQVTLSIRATSNGVPVGNDLVSEVVTVIRSPHSAWFEWLLNFTATPNTTYAFCVRHTSIHTLGMEFRNENVYVDGDRFSSTNSGSSWTRHSASDVAFKIEETVGFPKTIGRVYKTSANFNDSQIHNFIGFAKEPGIANDVKKVQIGGLVDMGVIAGKNYYLSNTPGAISTTPGLHKKHIGVAALSNKLFLMKQRKLEYFEILWGIPGISGHDWHTRTSVPNAILDIRFTGTSANTIWVGLREFGSTANRIIGSVNSSGSISGRVKTNGSGRFQIKGQDTSILVTGCWKEV